jgi:hypothetical protein
LQGLTDHIFNKYPTIYDITGQYEECSISYREDREFMILERKSWGVD